MPTGTAALRCRRPRVRTAANHVSSATDCNDAAATVNPGLARGCRRRGQQLQHHDRRRRDAGFYVDATATGSATPRAPPRARAVESRYVSRRRRLCGHNALRNPGGDGDLQWHRRQLPMACSMARAKRTYHDGFADTRAQAPRGPTATMRDRTCTTAGGRDLRRRRQNCNGLLDGPGETTTADLHADRACAAPRATTAMTPTRRLRRRVRACSTTWTTTATA